MFSLDEIVWITAGRLLSGQPKGRARGVSINTRTLRKGDAFIAIKGQNFDGHDFVKDAIKKGASVVIVQVSPKATWGQVPVVLVQDTVKALGLLARAHRDRFRIPVIAITGSAGKTTTKEMAAFVLSGKFHVLKNFATENNHIGVPMTLFRMRPRHQAAVIEVGTNRPGDIPWLATVVNPTAAVFTNIGESHLELLKSPLGVFREKSSLVRDIKKGAVIFNADDPFLRKVPALRKDLRGISFSVGGKAVLKADRIVTDNRSLRFRVNGRDGWSLRTPAAHNVHNALAAAGCGRLLGMTFDEVRGRLSRFPFPKSRQAVQRLQGRWLIDDTYNANPVSLRSALSTLAALKVPGRRVLVCGDMLELGRHSERLHRSVGRSVAAAGVDLLLALGKMTRVLAAEAARRNRGLEARHFSSVEELNACLKEHFHPGDALLVKGSRGMKMERVVSFVKDNWAA